MKKPQSRHHRKPKSLGGTAEPTNIVRLPHKKHVAFHLLFQNWNVTRIVEELNRFYIDPNYEIIARRKDVCSAQANDHAVVAASSPSHGALPANTADNPSYRTAPQPSHPSEEHTQ
jgi:hypothetical protein